MTAIWEQAGEEPALHEVLADPIVHLVMERDGLTPEGVGLFLKAQKRRLLPILRTRRQAILRGEPEGHDADKRRAS